MTRRTLLILVAIGLITAGPSARQAQDRLTPDLLEGASSFAASVRPSRPGASSTSRSTRRTRVSGTSLSAFGGLWKTTNRGITFAPIFDDNGVFTLCCIAIDPEGLERPLARHGREQQPAQRRISATASTSRTDAGKTWKRMGLETSEHIGDVLIDPRNSNVVYVAAQGPLFSEGGERGLYKTTDGGATWNAVLTISKDTGISDIVFDPRRTRRSSCAGR